MSIFLPLLKKKGHLDRLHITICNVGSRKLAASDDYGSQGWEVFAPNLTIYGLDADLDACEQANADLEARQVNWTEKHFALALWNTESEETLYVTHNPMCSSLYRPNETYRARFSQLLDVARLDFTIEVETTTLDAFCQREGIHTIDFLQTDVQGADLQVLQGASQLLERSVLALQTEAHFSPLYIDQPLFSDLDLYVREQGFTLFDISQAYRDRALSPIHSQTHPGQLLWGDVFYFRDLLQPDVNPALQTPDSILKLACIADILDFTDYALELLVYLTQKYGADPAYNVASAVLESMEQIPGCHLEEMKALPSFSRLQDSLSG